MRKRNIYRLVSVFIGLALSWAFMLSDLGVTFTPLTKLFVIFCGGIIGLQCLPAILLFVSMSRGIVTVNQHDPLTGNGVKS